jgi:hypothetical protein
MSAALMPDRIWTLAMSAEHFSGIVSLFRMSQECTVLSDVGSLGSRPLSEL